MRSPFIARREGRYIFRARWPTCVMPAAGSASLRISLRTSDYRVAVQRSAQLLTWFLPMKSTSELVDTLKSLCPRLFELAVEPIVTETQYVEASAFSTAMMRVCTGLTARGIEPETIVPGMSEHLLVFQREFIRAYGEHEKAKSVAGRLESRKRELGLLPETPRAIVLPRSGEPAPTGAIPEPTQGRRLSVLLDRFLAYKLQQNGDGRSDSDVGPIVRFAIALWGDPFVHQITGEQILDLKCALPEIPTNRGFSQEERSDLHFRYKTAQDCDWNRVRGDRRIHLKRPSVSTLKGRYKTALDAFFGWAVEHKFMAGPLPDFTFVTKKNPGKRKRDAFREEELLTLLSTPAFTGCASVGRCWQPGDQLYQSPFYWAVLIGILAGLRPGEISQLRCRDIRPLYGKMHFRFARSEADEADEDSPVEKQAKSQNAYRWAPVHGLLIRLGLLERRDAIVTNAAERLTLESGGRAKLSTAQVGTIELAAQEAWLFPEWKVYVRKTGVIQWSQALTKSWQYAQAKLDLNRRGITLYSARHTFKGFIDDVEALSDRSRRVIMGHSTEGDVHGQYGPKQITEAQMDVVLGLSNEAIEQIAHLLVSAKARAEAGELRMVEAWRKDVRSTDETFMTALAARSELYR